MRIPVALAVMALTTTLTHAASHPDDRTGCKDPPLVSRMSGYYISRCDQSPFDAWKIKDSKGKEVKVEGKVTGIAYDLVQGQPMPSRLQVIRNYENALKPLGGAIFVQYDDGAETYLKVAKDGRGTWVYLNLYNPGNWGLQILETAAMAQEVVADATVFSNDIKATGHAAIYGILFDTGKSEVKPESDAALREVAKLLAGDPQLKLLVVGHTDGVGQLEANMKLSQARAESVVKALTTKHGIAAARLRAQGAGPIAPVATNRTDEGRAKNRRVELVEQ
jgi:outer membrane protein OmpA-like peptidoglycan-associated protein